MSLSVQSGGIARVKETEDDRTSRTSERRGIVSASLEEEGYSRWLIRKI